VGQKIRFKRAIKKERYGGMDGGREEDREGGREEGEITSGSSEFSSNISSSSMGRGITPNIMFEKMNKKNCKRPERNCLKELVTLRRRILFGLEIIEEIVFQNKPSPSVGLNALSFLFQITPLILIRKKSNDERNKKLQWRARSSPFRSFCNAEKGSTLLSVHWHITCNVHDM
jgi:hypothetical protein